MYIVLLTGGLASGKDTVSAILAQQGATILDLDVIAKEEQVKEPVLSQLVEAFGADILDASGALNRPVLAARAFATKDSTQRLNEICWPGVQRKVGEYISEAEAEAAPAADLNADPQGQAPASGASRFLVIQVPLLVEAFHLFERKDEVISVVADANLRLERAVARGMSRKDAKNRLARQATDDERIAISDTVFVNNGSLEELRSQVMAWHRQRTEGGLL